MSSKRNFLSNHNTDSNTVSREGSLERPSLFILTPPRSLTVASLMRQHLVAQHLSHPPSPTPSFDNYTMPGSTQWTCPDPSDHSVSRDDPMWHLSYLEAMLAEPVDICSDVEARAGNMSSLPNHHTSSRGDESNDDDDGGGGDDDDNNDVTPNEGTK